VAKCGASIVARASIFFNTGDHVVEVALPTWLPPQVPTAASRVAVPVYRGGRRNLRRQADVGELPFDVVPVDLQADDLPLRPTLTLGRK